MRLRRSIVTALFAALLCIFAPISIPMGALPASLALFGVSLVALLSDRRCALMALLLYVCLGAVGLPVFAGFTGGAHVLVGPTGGYLLGYIPMVLIISSFCERRHSVLRMVLGMVAGLLTCYALGAAWYAISANVTFGAAVAVGVLPFILFDAVKLVAAGGISLILRNRMESIRFLKKGDEERS